MEEALIKIKLTHHEVTNGPDEDIPQTPSLGLGAGSSAPMSLPTNMTHNNRESRSCALCSSASINVGLGCTSTLDHLDAQRCLDRLPTSSPLRRLLVDLWVKNIQVNTSKNSRLECPTKAMEALSQSFLLECFAAFKGVAASRGCFADSAEACISPPRS